MKKLTVLILLMLSALTLPGADLTGTWSVAVALDAGTGAATFTFKQTGEALSGTYSGTFGQAQVTGTVKGDQVEWSFDNDQVGKVTYQGSLDGAGKMKGTVIYGQLGKGTFAGERIQK
jgi:carbon monoxide dehydrogenase subunit G